MLITYVVNNSILIRENGARRKRYAPPPVSVGRREYLELRVQKEPWNVALNNNLAFIYLQTGELLKALPVLQRSIKKDPSQGKICLNLAKACMQLTRYEEAIVYFNQAFRVLKTLDIEGFRMLMKALFFVGRPDACIATAEVFLKQYPDDDIACYYKACSLVSTGQIPQAVAYFQKALSAKPNNPSYFYQYALAERIALNDRFLLAAKTAYDLGELTGNHKILIGFALAAVYMRHNDYATTCRYLQEANSLKAGQQQRADVIMQADSRFTTRIKQHSSKERLQELMLHAPKPKIGKPEMIFVVGMPRSGTTLVERILASHSQVKGAGESVAMTEVARVGCMDRAGAYFPDVLSSVTSEQQSELLTMYWNLLKQRAYISNDVRYVVDKTPMNYHYIGLIRALMPQAKIIHCTRNRNDVALSLYKQFFTGEHPYAYAPATIHHHIDEYEKQMQHWQDVILDNQCYTEISYEQLVQTPEVVIRELFGFCDLPWEEQVLSFHRTKRNTMTASATQVVRPIYTSSVDGWKKYAEYLPELFQVA